MRLSSRITATLLALTLAADAVRAANQPAFEVKKEEQIIRSLAPKWAEAVAKKDIEIALSLYAPDVIVLDPDAPARRGLDAMRSSWTNLVKMPGVAIEITPEKIEFSVAGDFATEFGRFDLQFDGPNGPVKMVNKYLTIWRKINRSVESHLRLLEHKRTSFKITLPIPL